MMPRRESRKFSFLHSKVTFAIGGAVLVFIAMAIIDEVQRRRSVQREIHAIQDEVRRLESQRVRLTDLLEQADDPEFIEREARLRLGLQKPGETVFVVPESPDGSMDVTIPTPPSPQSNLRKWWTYVFHGEEQ